MYGYEYHSSAWAVLLGVSEPRVLVAALAPESCHRVVCMYACMNVCMCVCMYECVYIHIYIHTYMYICIHIYIYIYRSNNNFNKLHFIRSLETQKITTCFK